MREAVARGLLLKGGGHAMAAGVTVPPNGLPAFQAFLDGKLGNAVEAARREDVLRIDGLISAAALKPELCREISRGGPYGAGNPEPIFALADHVIIGADAVGANHLRLRLRSRDGSTASAIAFRAGDQPLGEKLRACRGRPVHLAGCLQLDEWGGRERVSLRIVDAAAASSAEKAGGS